MPVSARPIPPAVGNPWSAILAGAVAWIGLASGPLGLATAQIELEREPIRYSETPAQDPVARVQAQLDAGQVQLEYDAKRGYLPSVLKLLDIPASSQVLVHSKTSFQLPRISPQRPRALYFNDEVYVGWVQRGDVIEVMSTDPVQGEIFYTVSQGPGGSPKFIRDRGQCITCHASSHTQGVPGALVRSTFVDARGQPLFGAGTFTIDHRTPISQRWGGWYVSGTHGNMRHMGNVTSTDRDNPESLDRNAGANVTDLSARLDVTPYLTPHSDLVAMMVLEHQSQMHNFLTLASYEARSAAHYDRVMNEALGRPADFVSESTERRVASAGDKLLRYMLFVEEFPLASPVSGTSGFAEQFAQRGPRDSRGRSLRDPDLKTRMFRYPCSFLIYSPSFDRLPTAVRTYVATRLRDVLTGQDQSKEFAHLSTGDRQAILEILRETKPGLWNS